MAHRCSGMLRMTTYCPGQVEGQQEERLSQSSECDRRAGQGPAEQPGALGCWQLQGVGNAQHQPKCSKTATPLASAAHGMVHLTSTLVIARLGCAEQGGQCVENVPVEARTCAEADLGHLLGPPQLETPLQIPAGRKHLCKIPRFFLFVCFLIWFVFALFVWFCLLTEN